jgi:hypothetical protein
MDASSASRALGSGRHLHEDGVPGAGVQVQAQPAGGRRDVDGVAVQERDDLADE